MAPVKAYAVEQLLVACVFQLDRRQRLPTIELIDVPFLEPSTSRWPVWIDVVVPRCQEQMPCCCWTTMAAPPRGASCRPRELLWLVHDFEVRGFRTL